MVVAVWNELPAEVVSYSTISGYKQIWDKHISICRLKNEQKKTIIVFLKHEYILKKTL